MAVRLGLQGSQIFFTGIKGNLLGATNQLLEKYGNIVDVSSPSSEFGRVIVTDEPDIVRHVLQSSWGTMKKYTQRFGHSSGLEKLRMGNFGLIWNTDEQLRLVGRRCFKESVAKTINEVKYITQNVADEQISSGRWEGDVNILTELRLATLDIACRTLYGSSSASIIGGISACNLFIEKTVNYFKAWNYFLFNSLEDDQEVGNSHILAVKNMQNAVKELMIKAPQSGSLLSAIERHKVIETPEQVEQLVLESFLATIDTSAVQMAYILLYLCEQPNLRDVILRITEDELYCDAVIKETMRLKPVGPLILRKCMEDDEIALSSTEKISLESGENIILCIGRMHKRNDLWEKVNEFHPERFLTTSTETIPYFAPFGGTGPRSCLGQSFAKKEMSCYISELLKRVQLKSPLKSIYELETTWEVANQPVNLSEMVITCQKAK